VRDWSRMVTSGIMVWDLCEGVIYWSGHCRSSRELFEYI
jgi:hypothetical protein